MKTHYTLNYLKIYLWQGVSITLNLLSLFIVIPRLSDNPALYGIYALCISMNIFLAYADLGFVSAGMKYASESFARGNLEEEMRIVGFTGFVLAFFLMFFLLAVGMVAVNPDLLIKNIKSGEEFYTASYLLFTLAAFSPIMVFQRILEMIYGIRLENFVYQKVVIVANVMKILSVFYFFRESAYHIVGYFLFCQCMNLIAAIVSLGIVKWRYHYLLTDFFRYFRFSKELFEKIKPLAFGSLFVTISWILYYEMDSLVIAKTLGTVQIAVYAIGFTLLSFLRNILGVLFMPFSVRFNHFVGLKDMEGLRKMYRDIVILTLPVILFPIISLVGLMEPFVRCWVGGQYGPSILIAQLLLLGFVYSFFTYPGSFLIVAQEKISMIYLTSSLLPLVYWVGILMTISFWGLLSFALFKWIALTMNSMVYFSITLHFLKMSLWEFSRKILFPVVIPMIFLVSMLYYVNPFMPLEQSKANLLVVIATIGLISGGAFLLYCFFSKYFRDSARTLFRNAFG